MNTLQILFIIFPFYSPSQRKPLLCLFNWPRYHLLQEGFLADGVPAGSSACLRHVAHHVHHRTQYLSHLLLVSLSREVIPGLICVLLVPGMGTGPELGSINICPRNEWGKGISGYLTLLIFLFLISSLTYLYKEEMEFILWSNMVLHLTHTHWAPAGGRSLSWALGACGGWWARGLLPSLVAPALARSLGLSFPASGSLKPGQHSTNRDDVTGTLHSVHSRLCSFYFLGKIPPQLFSFLFIFMAATCYFIAKTTTTTTTASNGNSQKAEMVQIQASLLGKGGRLGCLWRIQWIELPG